MITAFKGTYEWLSNMYPCYVIYQGVTYYSVEQAYQAQKTTIATERSTIINEHNPYKCKQLGKRVTLRSDWNEVKLSIMFDLLMTKFRNNPDLQDKLIATGTQELVEGNWWHDTYWGVCNEIGENHLGRLLMKVRALY